MQLKTRDNPCSRPEVCATFSGVLRNLMLIQAKQRYLVLPIAASSNY